MNIIRFMFTISKFLDFYTNFIIEKVDILNIE